MAETQGVFLRQASGLIRTVSLRDVFIYNMGLVNMGIGLATMMLYGPAYYAGASIWLSCVIVGAFCVLQALTYWHFSSIMPRTGGEYVYISRSLHPALGLAMSFSMSLWLLSYSAWSAKAFADQGLQSLLGDLGDGYNSSTLTSMAHWVGGQWGAFIVAIVMIALAVFLLSRGMGAYLKVQVVFFALAMLGLVVVLGVLLFSSRSEFIANFNATATNIAGPNRYQTVIDAANKSGYANPGFDWSQTIKFMVWPYWTLGFAIMSASFAGEIKKADRAQLWGMSGAVVFTTAVYVVIALLANHVIGYTFMGAVSWNTVSAPEATTSIYPWIQYLIGIGTGRVWASFLIDLGFLAWTYFWIGGCLLYATRAVFAWSFDRVMPEWLGKVSARSAAPVNAIVVGGALSAVFAAMYCFTTLLQSLVGILAITLTFVVVGISAVVFPYRHRELFEDSHVNRRVLGVPVMAILGAVTAGFMGYISWLFFHDSLAAGATRNSLLAVFGPIVIVLLYFFVARAVRKRAGIDVELAYQEIPLE
jgi:amino acid transporter